MKAVGQQLLYLQQPRDVSAAAHFVADRETPCPGDGWQGRVSQTLLTAVETAEATGCVAAHDGPQN